MLSPGLILPQIKLNSQLSHCAFSFQLTQPRQSFITHLSLHLSVVRHGGTISKFILSESMCPEGRGVREIDEVCLLSYAPFLLLP